MTPSDDNSDLTNALIVGFVGGVSLALLNVILVFCIFQLIFNCPHQKKTVFYAAKDANVPSSHPGLQNNLTNGFNTVRSENHYDYIESTTLPSKNGFHEVGSDRKGNEFETETS